MKRFLISPLLGLVLVAVVPASHAQVGVDFNFNTCGYPGYAYTCPVYGPPIGVYFGGGAWGGDRGYRGGERNGWHGRGGHGHRGR